MKAEKYWVPGGTLSFSGDGVGKIFRTHEDAVSHNAFEFPHPVYLVPAEEYEALQKDGDSTIKILQQILVILDDDRASIAAAIYLCRQYLNVAKFLKEATDES